MRFTTDKTGKLNISLVDRCKSASLALFDGTRIGNALSAFFVNRYEAAQPSGPGRSFIPAFVRDARYDANAYSRWEMLRKVRYFERNNWIIPKMREVYIKYTVGASGIPVIPASSDEEWNKHMLESYSEWCERPARDNLLPMGENHKIMSGERHVEGEIFILKTRIKEAGKQARPAIQLVESHRISNPGLQFSLNDNIFSSADGNIGPIDGVEVDSNGTPAGYWSRDSIAGDSWTFRSAKDMLHIYRPTRVGMYRNVTPYHAVLNTLHDLDDLQMFEMQRAKINASIAYFLKNAAGEFNQDIVRLGRYMTDDSIPTPNQMPSEDLEKRIEQMKTILGSSPIALKLNEELGQLKNENPSAATQWYWKYLISQICSALGVPMILIWPESIQGTVARGIYDDANTFFRGEFYMFAHAAINIYRFYADWARYNDKRLVDPPADWWKCHVVPPRAVNVDVGRNSAAILAEYAAGLISLEDICGAYGTTPEVLITKKARNVGRIKQIAKQVATEMGVDIDPAEVSAPLADILAKLAAANQANSVAENAGETGNEKELVEA